MKIIVSILTVSFIFITVCIAYLVKSGISIRTAPIIKPSIISNDFENVPQGLFVRLFPDLQQADYILWGISQNSVEVQKTLTALKNQYEKEFKTPVRFIFDGLKASAQDIEKCSKPCWIYLPEDSAHELKPNTWIQKNIKPSNRNYFTISWVSFTRTIETPEYCLKEKRLDLECLKAISVQEFARKKMSPRDKYFFVKKYLDTDYFLFVEQ
ncbi:MAG: hypothetical protein ACXVCY_00530 [Pseudobdellovibrionaceae bacterium]